MLLKKISWLLCSIFPTRVTFTHYIEISVNQIFPFLFLWCENCHVDYTPICVLITSLGLVDAEFRFKGSKDCVVLVTRYSLWSGAALYNSVLYYLSESTFWTILSVLLLHTGTFHWLSRFGCSSIFEEIFEIYESASIDECFQNYRILLEYFSVSAANISVVAILCLWGHGIGLGLLWH